MTMHHHEGLNLKQKPKIKHFKKIDGSLTGK
jgi:hypothetical protein